MLKLDTVTQIISLFSVSTSAVVIMTAIIFPSMRRRKVYMPIIVMISVCDIMGNLPYCMGVCPSNGEVLCSFQGFLNLYFYPISWMYSTMLVYLLRGAFFYQKVPLSETAIHVPCWTLPLVFSLLILTTNNYASAGADICICTIGGTHVKDGIIWHSVTYYGLLFACFGLMLFWFIEIRKILLMPRYFNVGIVLLQYPAALFVAWFPYAVSNIVAYCSEDPSQYDRVIFVTEQAKILHGSLTAIIFFANSSEARQRWSKLLCPSNLNNIEEDYFEVSREDVASTFLSDRLLSVASKSSQLVQM